MSDSTETFLWFVTLRCCHYQIGETLREADRVTAQGSEQEEVFAVNEAGVLLRRITDEERREELLSTISDVGKDALGFRPRHHAGETLAELHATLADYSKQNAKASFDEAVKWNAETEKCPLCDLALVYYDGALGYESYICPKCHLDRNDWNLGVVEGKK